MRISGLLVMRRMLSTSKVGSASANKSYAVSDRILTTFLRSQSWCECLLLVVQRTLVEPVLPVHVNQVSQLQCQPGPFDTTPLWVGIESNMISAQLHSMSCGQNYDRSGETAFSQT